MQVVHQYRQRLYFTSAESHVGTAAQAQLGFATAAEKARLGSLKAIKSQRSRPDRDPTGFRKLMVAMSEAGLHPFCMYLLPLGTPCEAKFPKPHPFYSNVKKWMYPPLMVAMSEAGLPPIAQVFCPGELLPKANTQNLAPSTQASTSGGTLSSRCRCQEQIRILKHRNFGLAVIFSGPEESSHRVNHSQVMNEAQEVKSHADHLESRCALPQQVWLPLVSSSCRV